MKQYEIPLEEGKFYHIYNRGINGTDLFYDRANYTYFLLKYSLYLSPVVDTYAYCLLKNHFHLLIRVKEQLKPTVQDLLDNPAEMNKKGLHSPDRIVSKKFSDFFNSYSKSINKSYGRTGGLFETPFRRISIEDDAYFSRMVWYIHWNPQKHGFVKNFKDYPHSSYNSLLTNKPTRLERDYVLNWFGNNQEYKLFHELMHSEDSIRHLMIEEE